ncbi:hypothetical protein PVAG01_11492 [Phlyctema vagabunda]|uniref:Uncharacterized protein n=1 Tax=Phlyctema vagabunda TaxID=108571 RepID=A0ABR4P190_9HELO
MLRRFELESGAPSVVAPEKKRSSSADKLKARHQRFYEYRRLRREEVGIEQRSDSEQTPTAEETPNEVTSDDEKSIVQPSSATLPPPGASKATTAIESQATSNIAPPQQATSAAEPAVSASNIPISQVTTNQPPQIATSTPRSFSTTFTPKDHSPASTPTALPITQDSSTRSPSTIPASLSSTPKTTSEPVSTTEQVKPTRTTPTVKEQTVTSLASQITASSSLLSTATAIAGGLGPSQKDGRSGLSGVAMALIILGVLLSAILMIGLAYAFVKRSIIFERLRNRGSESRNHHWPQPQSQQPATPPPRSSVVRSRTSMFHGMPIPFRSQVPTTPMTESHDNRIWGAASTVGTETVGDYPNYVPPLMQKGGVYDPNGQQDARSEAGPHPALIDPASLAPPPVLSRQSVLRHQSRYTESTRDSVMTSTTSTTLSSIPRFRTIKSWTQDQRRRVRDLEEVPAMPRRVYERL